MGFERRHRRGEVLRHLGHELDTRLGTGEHVLLDRALECPGVADTFADDVDLVAALLLRWSARLSASLERELAREPRDRSGAVAQAWASTAADLPGTRRLLDEQLQTPSGARMAALVDRARDLERARLAWAAGLGAASGVTGVAVGARLEQAARDRWTLSTGGRETRLPRSESPSRTSSARLAQRIRALIPA